MRKSTILAGRQITSIFGALVAVNACSAEGPPEGAMSGARAAQTATSDAGDGGEDEVETLEEAKLIVEHNATDQDTGFQVFVDGDPWDTLDIRGPTGNLLKVKAQGRLGDLGLTELFLETNEPENADVPIDELLSMMPEGAYEIEATSVEGTKMAATALLSHTIPAGPVITSPSEGALIDPTAELVIDWEPVTQSITGGGVTIAAYELIVEKQDAEPHPTAFADTKLDIHVPSKVTSVTVPKEFLEPDTEYEIEVLAIEESGPQTISSREFETE